jgi:hypothetical protein
MIFVGYVFLDNCYLVKKKECLTFVKQHLNKTTVAMATVTFHYGRYFDFKVTTSVTPNLYCISSSECGKFLPTYMCNAILYRSIFHRDM